MAGYYLSAIVSMLGPVDSVSGFCGKGFDRRLILNKAQFGTYLDVEIPTHYSAVLNLKSGVIVSMNMSFDIWRSGLPKFEIYGTDGTISYPDPNFGGGVPPFTAKSRCSTRFFRKTKNTGGVKQRCMSCLNSITESAIIPAGSAYSTWHMRLNINGRTEPARSWQDILQKS